MLQQGRHGHAGDVRIDYAGEVFAFRHAFSMEMFTVESFPCAHPMDTLHAAACNMTPYHGGNNRGPKGNTAT
eukprot:153397-Chlamydomonas_euryale.AAC.1